MAQSINQVRLFGRVTDKPDLRTTPNGQTVVHFSVALNRSYKDANDEWQEETEFVDVTAWAKLAEQTNLYLKKGDRVLVEGRLQNRSWEQDGVKRSKMDVVANDLTFVDKVAASEGLRRS